MDVDEGGWQPSLPGFFASHQGSDKQKKDYKVNKIKRMLSSVKKQMLVFASHHKCHRSKNFYFVDKGIASGTLKIHTVQQIRIF